MSIYVIANQIIQSKMEELPDNISAEHKTVYFTTHIKVLDISQMLKTIDSKLIINQIKHITSTQFSLACQTQPIFQELGIHHLYSLFKLISINFTTIISILLRQIEKPSAVNPPKHPESKEKELERKISQIKEVKQQSNSENKVKFNKLGGISLYNQCYSRQIEDQKILEEIREEKKRKTSALYREQFMDSVLQEIDHQTDVQANPSSNDDVANYIMQNRNKASIFNYVPYSNSLAQMVEYFNQSQNQANQYLTKMGNQFAKETNKESFGDFQREMRQKYSDFRKIAVGKMKELLKKLKGREKDIFESISKQSAIINQFNQKKKHKTEIEVQTEESLLSFNTNIQTAFSQLKLRCQILQNLKNESVKLFSAQIQLKNEIKILKNQIQKRDLQIKQNAQLIEKVKRMFRQQKLKKIPKEQLYKIFAKIKQGDTENTPRNQSQVQTTAKEDTKYSIARKISHLSTNILKNHMKTSSNGLYSGSIQDLDSYVGKQDRKSMNIRAETQIFKNLVDQNDLLEAGEHRQGTLYSEAITDQLLYESNKNDMFHDQTHFNVKSISPIPSETEINDKMQKSVGKNDNTPLIRKISNTFENLKRNSFQNLEKKCQTNEKTQQQQRNQKRQSRIQQIVEVSEGQIEQNGLSHQEIQKNSKNVIQLKICPAFSIHINSNLHVNFPQLKKYNFTATSPTKLPKLQSSFVLSARSPFSNANTLQQPKPTKSVSKSKQKENHQAVSHEKHDPMMSKKVQNSSFKFNQEESQAKIIDSLTLFQIKQSNQELKSNISKIKKQIEHKFKLKQIDNDDLKKMLVILGLDTELKHQLRETTIIKTGEESIQYCAKKLNPRKITKKSKLQSHFSMQKSNNKSQEQNEAQCSKIIQKMIMNSGHPYELQKAMIRLRKNIDQSAILAHIRKYFQTILKFTQIKKERRDLLKLHIQNVGAKNGLNKRPIIKQINNENDQVRKTEIKSFYNKQEKQGFLPSILSKHSSLHMKNR